jgi:hypothetical protein
MTACPAAGEARPRPALELADVIRLHGESLPDLTSEQRKVLNALSACRTAALGGHVETCDHCGHQRVAYNSCRKPPFGGPEQVLKYLSRYTHRIAISNARLVAMDDHDVIFRWKDYAHENRGRVMTLEGAEFLRRFLMHVVPTGFVRIRHFGLLANRFRTSNLSRCRELLAAIVAWFEADAHPSEATTGSHDRCPVCGKGEMTRGAFVRPNDENQFKGFPSGPRRQHQTPRMANDREALL